MTFTMTVVKKQEMGTSFVTRFVFLDRESLDAPLVVRCTPEEYEAWPLGARVKVTIEPEGAAA